MPKNHSGRLPSPDDVENDILTHNYGETERRHQMTGTS
ncbi:hypothetical protein KNP414_00816 [Paenibacillus mucilaginosus KNP414]|uniref:Uncharacterized protein n=1 Tax=Paenibacillus mucilaginosus (strain KNP414) TaxID=1036673 RepID=F8F4L4_PAEMK|nr:hypothetical protein KNP414_00816 [Paenibacillus mucilaginosus KNP414]